MDENWDKGFPVMVQGSRHRLEIQVNEFFGLDENENPLLCPLDSGKVTIFDEIADRGDEPVVLTVKNGLAIYETVASSPSVLAGRKDENGQDRSYQKAITALAEADDLEPARRTEWVVVTGERARIGTFVSAVTEEFPLFILRDPPGDNSSSFLEEGKSVCTSFSEMLIEDPSTLTEISVSVGAAAAAGLGFAVIMDIEAEIGGGLRSAWKTPRRTAPRSA